MADVGPRPETFCPSCGEILPQLERMARLIDSKDDVIMDQAGRIRGLHTVIAQMKGEQLEGTPRDPLSTDARRVFEYWRGKVAPKAREFTDDRFVKVCARLRAGHTVADIKRAIDGAALKPYVVGGGRRSATGRADERHVDLELICRKEAKLLAFIAIADAADEDREHRDLVPAGRLTAWQDRMDSPGVLARLEELRGWKPDVVRSLGLGLDGSRVVFPIRDATGHLVGICRYQPNPARRGSRPKLVAEGSRELFPAPETVDASTVWLVEGEPDAVACRSVGFPAVAVPGVAKWEDGWARRFGEFERVVICFDCDEQGRTAADQRMAEIGSVTRATTVDLDPGRDDGHDIGEVLLTLGEGAAAHLTSLTAKRGGTSILPFEQRNGGRPFDEVIRALEDRGLTVRHRGSGAAQCQCPTHDDREPSLTVTEADDGRVLLHCHAGCATDRIVEELGMGLADLFAEGA